MRFIPLIFILVTVLIVFGFGLTEYLSLEELSEKHIYLKSYVALHPVLAPFLYILIYIAITAVALPVDTFLVILGGYLFPEPYSLIYVTIGASTGATLLFLSTKTAVGGLCLKWVSPFLKKMEKGFQENAVSYLLFLRLLPVFPFWLTNISPAFFGVSLFTYYWTTAVGVIPFAFVFTQAGTGISCFMDANQALTLDKLFNHNMRFALVGLAILVLLPIGLKHYFHRQQTR